MNVAAILASNVRRPLHDASELALQDAVGVALAAARIRFQREVALSASSRPDFLVEDSIAVEVKVDGAARTVLRQLTRYLLHESITSAVLVTTRARHRAMPTTVLGKQIIVVWLSAL